MYIFQQTKHCINIGSPLQLKVKEINLLCYLSFFASLIWKFSDIYTCSVIFLSWVAFIFSFFWVVSIIIVDKFCVSKLTFALVVLLLWSQFSWYWIEEVDIKLRLIWSSSFFNWHKKDSKQFTSSFCWVVPGYFTLEGS